MTKSQSIFAVIMCWCVTAACGQAPDEQEGLAQDTLFLSARPQVSIGGGANDDLFGVTSLTRLASGMILVADRSKRIRWYDLDGTLLKETGGEGKGPGEYGYIASLIRFRGDSLLIHDPLNGRITILDSAGDVSRVVPFRSHEPGNLRIVARFTDGSLLTERSDYFTRPSRLGIARDSVLLERISESGTAIHSYGRFGGVYWHTRQEGQGPFESVWLPFSGPTLAAATGDTTWIVEDGGPELRGYADGDIVLRDSLPDPRRPLTESDLNAWVRGLTELTGSDVRADAMRPRVEPLIRVADRAPYRRMLADSRGRLWLELEPASPVDPSTWMRVQVPVSGSARLTLPNRFEAFEFGQGYVLGVYTDDLDVEQVQVWGIDEGRAEADS